MYEINQIISKMLKANCYIVNDEKNFFIIDPCVDIKQIFDIVTNNQKCLGILLTHGHIDHILTLQGLYDYFQCPIYCHQEAYLKLLNNNWNYATFLNTDFDLKIDRHSFTFLKNNEILNFGFVKVKTICTPGHTNCSVSFLMLKEIFTGDTLFSNDIGRTDLYSGNNNQLAGSLRKLASLDGSITIYPGHGRSSQLMTVVQKNKEFKRAINRQ